MKRLLSLVILAGAAVPVTAQTAHSGHSMPMSMADMNAAMLKELKPLTGRAFDIRWTQRMIDHHQMALGMAGSVLTQGRNPTVKAEAQKVMTAQRNEIRTMTAWLKTWTGKTYLAKSMPTAHWGNAGVDRWFLTEMIPHHQGAIDMSALAKARTKEPKILALAASIQKTQAAEIATYRALLRTVK